MIFMLQKFYKVSLGRQKHKEARDYIRLLLHISDPGKFPLSGTADRAIDKLCLQIFKEDTAFAHYSSICFECQIT